MQPYRFVLFEYDNDFILMKNNTYDFSTPKKRCKPAIFKELLSTWALSKKSSRNNISPLRS